MSAKRTRRCHGCHGLSDEDHASVPLGADRCPLDHDDRCTGGILAGKDRKGRDWRPCPVGYLAPTDRIELDSLSESNGEDEYMDNNLENDKSPSATCSSAPSLATNTISGAQSLLSLVSTTVTFSTAQKSPISTTSLSTTLGHPSTTHMADLAALEELKKECAALEKQAKEQEYLQEQQRVSAEREELKRQLQAQKDRLEMLKQSSRPSAQAGAVESLRQQSHNETLSLDFPNYYQGPNIKHIRKSHGLRSNAEKVVESVRHDIPSLGRRPTASNPGEQLGARQKHSHVDQQRSKLQQEFEEFKEFKAWKDRNAATDSDSDASPPRATTKTRPVSDRQHIVATDPTTDPSSSEDESSQPVILVYRRDKHGKKYRSYEPYQAVHGTEGYAEAVQHVWVTDELTGREYKQAVSAKPASNKPSKSQVSSSRHRAKHVDHRTDSETPTGRRQGVRSPPSSTQHHRERVPGIVPLEDKDGKSDDKKTPTIVDWAKNCPVAYAEKIKYDEMNLPVFVWAYVSEILSSRSGMSPDMPRGELEARLQHLLCVLQIALVHSEKTDFNTKGWSIASTYAKRVQQKLDRGLEVWDDFKRFGHDPHPSEMFSAKTEVDKRAPPRKKKEDENQAFGARKICTTWNNFEVERKCQYLVNNPNATKCIRRHDCSYCLEKGHGTLNHQRRFCRKKREAGDE